MAYLVQVNDAEYGDNRCVIEAKSWWNRGSLDWAVPAWEEMGLGELSGEFSCREDAERALQSAADILPMYGFQIAPAA